MGLNEYSCHPATVGTNISEQDAVAIIVVIAYVPVHVCPYTFCPPTKQKVRLLAELATEGETVGRTRNLISVLLSDDSYSSSTQP